MSLRCGLKVTRSGISEVTLLKVGISESLLLTGDEARTTCETSVSEYPSTDDDYLNTKT